MSIHDVFYRFIRRLKPTYAELDKARRRRDYLQNRMFALNMGIIDVRNSGSYAKSTAIRPMNDIDVVFYVDAEYYPYENVERMLHQIARALRSSYPQNEIVPKKRSIELRYVDGFCVDIVPALCMNRQIEGAEIFDRQSGRWIKTSISKHVEFANIMNEYDRRYKNLVRMLKVWKELRRRKIPSFLLSLLIADAILSEGLSRGWEKALYDIFEYVNEHRLDSPIWFNIYHRRPRQFPRGPVVVIDPANPQNNVAHFMDRKFKREFLNAWNNSFNQVRKADNSSYKKDKIYYWSLVFGDRFPAR